MDRTIRTYESLEQMKAEEYRYWQSRPAHERIAGVYELSQAMYAMKGAAADAPRFERTLVRFERKER
jgi:hypothetical protein